MSVIDWWRRRQLIGAMFLYGGAALALGSGGWDLSQMAATRPVAASTATRTLTRTHIIRHTVRVRAVVLRREDHVLTVYVRRQVFHAAGRIFVVHGVFRLKTDGSGATLSTAAIIAGSPVTVTVPVTETVASPPVTVSEPATTITATTTEPPVTVTVTVSVPLPGGSSQ